MEAKRYLSATIGAMLVSAALTLVNYGAGITTAMAAPPVKDDPHAGLTQNWDRNLPSASRFTVLTEFSGAAVRDNNTGVVWEQTPDATIRTWSVATLYCLNKNVGGTRGWRLPSVAELTSLIDPSLPSPFVPANVFNNVQFAGYWSATTVADVSVNAWDVFLGDGTLFSLVKTASLNTWCVRGGMNADAY